MLEKVREFLEGKSRKKTTDDKVMMDAFGNIYKEPPPEQKTDVVRLFFKDIPDAYTVRSVSRSVLKNKR